MKKKVIAISREHDLVSTMDRLNAEEKEWKKRKAFLAEILEPKKENVEKPVNYKEYYANLDRSCNELLSNIKRYLPELKELLKSVLDHWVYEDLVYRFYHQSFKVYHVQDETIRILYALGKVAPKGTKWDTYFLQIVREGTGKVFKREHNDDWAKHTRPMLEAFFHAKYFLEMAVTYGEELKESPVVLPSGYAGLLCLYGLR